MKFVGSYICYWGVGSILEGVPQRYVIVRANQYMVKTCNAITCYVKHYGNSKALLELAIRREQKSQLIIENIGQHFGGNGMN